MPEAVATHAELIFRHCVEVARFVRPFVASAEAARVYVRRTFVRAATALVASDPEPETTLARLALHEVARAPAPVGSLWPLLDAVNELDRAAFVLVWVQELPIYRVASVLQLSLGKLLRRAEHAAHQLVARVELESLVGASASDSAPNISDCLETLRRELAITWSNAERTELVADVLADLDAGLTSWTSTHALQRAPFPRAELAPAPPPAPKPARQTDAAANRNARRHRLRSVRALAGAPRALLDSGTFALRELCAALRPATPLPFVWIPPNPTRPRARRASRALWPLPLSLVMFVLAARAAQAIFPPRAPLATGVARPVAPDRVQRPLALVAYAPPKSHAEHAVEADPEPLPPASRGSRLVHEPVPIGRVAALAPLASVVPAVVTRAAPLSLQEAMERSVGQPATSTAPAPAVAVAGDVQRPSVGAVSVAIGKVKERARACLGPDEAPSRATVVFGSSGAVAQVIVTGPASFTAQSRCIEAALGSARVPAFRDESFSASLTIRP